MPRIPRKNMINSSFFHIMVQGINKEYIFNTEKNMNKYLELIYKNNIDIQIIAYCVMNNHAHILIRTEDMKNIEIWMRKTNTSYAIFYNKNNNRVGYVFRNRYKVQSINDIRYLYTCMEYIHNNPVKAKICKNKEEYQFSSYLKIYNGNPQNIYNELTKILQLGNNLEMIFDENEEEFKFLEEEETNKEEICSEIINEFLKHNQLKLKDLRTEKEGLKILIKILKSKHNISYRLMERQLKINRETLRKMMLD